MLGFAQVQMPEEVRAIVLRYRGAFVTVALLSAVLNVLVLGGSIYMMMVYDSVLPSHSIPTLVGLLVMLVAVYAFQGTFEVMRSRILSDVANSFDNALSHRVQKAMATAALQGYRSPGGGMGPMRDLESVRSYLAGPGPATLIDMPWIVFFLAILTMLHYWLGLTALIGAAALVGLTFITNKVTAKPTVRLSAMGAYRNSMAESNLRHIETLSSLGMRARMLDRWEQVNRYYLAAQRSLGDSTATLGMVSRTGRMFLQSLILTVGALLVIDGKASGGVIFASSILSARALAPVDQAIATWRNFAAARLGWNRLCELLTRIPPEPDIHTVLPAPTREMAVQQLVVGPPATQSVTVQGVDFRLSAGDGLAIVGPSAAGKSSLARVLAGIWNPLRGHVRLDGAALDQWQSDVRGGMIGYLPQTVELLEGSVADNIARFDPEATSENVIKAAMAAGVHDLIVNLPMGYETPVGPDGASLSGGQQQRIALARALYKDPFLVLLDEPNSNLDAEGDAALEQAIGQVRARGGIVIVISHRSSALSSVSHVLFLRNGRMEAFGPRDEVLQSITNRPAIAPHPQAQPQPQPRGAAAPPTQPASGQPGFASRGGLSGTVRSVSVGTH